MATKKKKIPFDFILEHLYPYEPLVKPMFGAYGVYIDEKIMLILFDKLDHPKDSGVWVATNFEHHESLRRELPSLRSIRLFGKSETKWQNIPAEGDRFEQEVIQACELVLKKDERIGITPQKKKKKRVNNTTT